MRHRIRLDHAFPLGSNDHRCFRLTMLILPFLGSDAPAEVLACSMTLTARARFCSSCLGEKLAKRDESTRSASSRRAILGRTGDSNNRPKLRGLLNRPQRERLPCLKVGILMIGKIKPTIAIRAEVRLIFSEIEFIECTSMVFTDLNG